MLTTTHRYTAWRLVVKPSNHNRLYLIVSEELQDASPFEAKNAAARKQELAWFLWLPPINVRCYFVDYTGNTLQAYLETQNKTI